MRIRTAVVPAAPMVIAVVAVLGALAFGAPALAADPDYKGWYGNLDLALTQPDSLDQHFANHVQFPGNGAVSNERMVIDNDDSLTFRFEAGYSWGRKGSLQISYWQFDNDDSQSDTLNGGVYPSLFGYGVYGGQYIYNATGVDFEATSSEKATTWDVDYIRPMSAGEKLTIKWLAGLRVASYEEDQTFEGSDGIYTYTQDKHFDSDAVGLRVGATMVFDFTKSFGVEAGAAFSFLQGDLSGTSHQSCPAGSNCDGAGVRSHEENEASDGNVRGDIQDYHVRAVWNHGPIDWYVGYGMSAWGGLVADPVPAIISPAVGATPSRGRDNIAFSGWQAGVRYRFGPH